MEATSIAELARSARATDPEERAAARAEVHDRARRGDEAAIALLPALYYDAVLATALARGAPGPAAEDVAQETFLRITRACRAGLAELRMPAYGRTIAANLVEDWRRRGWREVAAEVEREAHSPESDVRAAQVRAAYEALLAEQDERRRDIVHRWLFGGEDLSAIAARWDTSDHAAKNVVLRFRKELAARLLASGTAA